MKKFSLSLLLMFIVSVLFSSVYAYDGNSSCVKCHSDKEKITELGYPQLYLDPKQVDKEVNMGGIPTCVDCHLGNNQSMEKDKAHKNMPRPFYAAIGKNFKYEAVSRKVTDYERILPKGNNRAKLLLRQPTDKVKAEYGIKKIIQLFYHDRNPKTMAYSPEIAEKTCGKCHSEETENYNESGMGLNKYQRGFTSFKTSPPGPHNCGAWFGDNYEKISGECTKDFTKEMNAGKARGCNKCHASCNDCHYKGFEKSKASHVFQGQVETLSCYGSGKGTICHAGPMDRRRGAGYLRKEFAFPYGELPQDVHAKMGLSCTECHKMEKHDYGHIGSGKVKESCSDCHSKIVTAVNTGKHKNVDCTSCHIKEVGAYQFTFWGPGKSEGMDNLYAKHKQYYGTRDLPLLVKHPAKDKWIPVKPYPMGAMNIKGDVKPTGLKLREIKKTKVEGNTKIGEPKNFITSRNPDEVNDMYIITGKYEGFENNDNMMAWIQMDKMSHALGEPRKCESCHSSHKQVMKSWFTYNNMTDVKNPFSGSYIIKAGKEGMYFSDFEHTEIQPVKGRNIDDFAPFVMKPDAWDVEGIDFSIPFNEKKYENDTQELNKIYAEIHNLKMQYKNSGSKKAELEEIKTILYHNRDMAKEMLAAFKSNN